MSDNKPQNPDDDLLSIDDAYIPVDEHVEYVSKGGKTVSFRGIYLLPNLLTTAALFCGFYSILSSIQHNYENAVIAVFCAAFFDMLDGRVARLLNAQSEFGVEYDSLSDLISFGMAPAILAFQFGLHELNKLGWSISFFFVVCAALRLARFNTQTSNSASSFFSGLASPAAAGCLIACIWCLFDNSYQDGAHSFFALSILGFLTVSLGFLMVSNLLYYSFKNINFNGRISFVLLLIIIFVLLLINSNPPLFTFLFAAIYVLSGIVYTIYRKRQKQSPSEQAES